MKNIIKIDFILPCFNQEKYIEETVSHILNLQLKDEYQVNIIIVDDHSNDTSQTKIENLQKLYSNIRLINLPENSGRSLARNKGMELSDAEFLILLDADCFIRDKTILDKFFKYFNEGYSVVIGNITAEGNSFWDKYQKEVSDRRIRNQNVYDLTAAVIGFNREAIFKNSKIINFDERYKGYGFEDRDFIIRLVDQLGKNEIVHAEDIFVLHEGCPDLKNICIKMRNAARETAPIFFNLHKSFYEKSRFAVVDVKFMNYGMKVLFGFLMLFTAPVLVIGEYAINSTYVPYMIKKQIMLLCVSLSYYSGSRER